MGGGGEVKKRVTPFLRPHGPPFALLSDFYLGTTSQDPPNNPHFLQEESEVQNDEAFPKMVQLIRDAESDRQAL